MLKIMGKDGDSNPYLALENLVVLHTVLWEFLTFDKFQQKQK